MCSLATFRQKSPLMNKMRGIMRAMRMSPRTEDAYVHYVSDFFHWSGWRKPETLTVQNVTDYLSHLATERNVAASTILVAEAALKFAMKIAVKRRSFRESSNLLTRDEMKRLIAVIPAKYLPHLEDSRSFRALKSSRKMHRNSPIYAMQSASEKSIGRRVTPNGFFHSKILHEIAGGMSWADAEKKHGQQKIKTACADFVRQFRPGVLLAYLTTSPKAPAPATP